MFGKFESSKSEIWKVVADFGGLWFWWNLLADFLKIWNLPGYCPVAKISIPKSEICSSKSWVGNFEYSKSEIWKVVADFGELQFWKNLLANFLEIWNLPKSKICFLWTLKFASRFSQNLKSARQQKSEFQNLKSALQNLKSAFNLKSARDSSFDAMPPQRFLFDAFTVSHTGNRFFWVEKCDFSQVSKDLKPPPLPPVFLFEI